MSPQRGNVATANFNPLNRRPKFSSVVLRLAATLVLNGPVHPLNKNVLILEGSLLFDGNLKNVSLQI